MKLSKNKSKRSKKVLARKPHRTYHVKEVVYLEDYMGSGKRPIELFYPVKDYTSGGLPAINY